MSVTVSINPMLICTLQAILNICLIVFFLIEHMVAKDNIKFSTHSKYIVYFYCTVALNIMLFICGAGYFSPITHK